MSPSHIVQGLCRWLQSQPPIPWQQGRHWSVGGQGLGWISEAAWQQWGQASALFLPQGDGLLLASEALLQGQPSAVQQWVQHVHQQGGFPEWRDELYPVRLPDDDYEQDGSGLGLLERGAFRLLGLTSRAVHLNGWVRDGEDLWLWAARRSTQKAIDPGRWDNLMGGGVAHGESLQQAMLRECWEEAGIPQEGAQHARIGNRVLSCHLRPDGLHREWLFVYDLTLPADFVPQNQDGEVAEHALLSVPMVLEWMRDGAFTPDSGRVILDGLLRRHYFGDAGALLARALYHP